MCDLLVWVMNSNRREYVLAAGDWQMEGGMRVVNNLV